MIGSKVFIYWNITKKVWSIRHKGKVVGHANTLSLSESKFKVSEKGRQRVLASKTKNVHAGVVGVLECINPETPTVESILVSYNPYRFPWFYNVSTQQVIENRVYDNVFLNENGKVNLC